MAIELALYQPDIPQNTGTLLRLGACLDMRVHIIHPTGFAFSAKSFRRAAMDYAHHVQLTEHDDFAQFSHWSAQKDKRLILLTTGASHSAYDFEFTHNDIILMGRESAGVPDPVQGQCDARLRIPMAAQMRSMNVSIAAALIVGEARRQTDGFKGLK